MNLELSGPEMIFSLLGREFQGGRIDHPQTL
jgi:hypothetical protein